MKQSRKRADPKRMVKRQKGASEKPPKLELPGELWREIIHLVWEPQTHIATVIYRVSRRPTLEERQDWVDHRAPNIEALIDLQTVNTFWEKTCKEALRTSRYSWNHHANMAYHTGKMKIWAYAIRQCGGIESHELRKYCESAVVRDAPKQLKIVLKRWDARISIEPEIENLLDLREQGGEPTKCEKMLVRANVAWEQPGRLEHDTLLWKLTKEAERKAEWSRHTMLLREKHRALEKGTLTSKHCDPLCIWRGQRRHKRDYNDCGQKAAKHSIAISVQPSPSAMVLIQEDSTVLKESCSEEERAGYLEHKVKNPHKSVQLHLYPLGQYQVKVQYYLDDTRQEVKHFVVAQ